MTITLSDPVVVSKATDEIDVQINFERRFTVKTELHTVLINQAILWKIIS